MGLRILVQRKGNAKHTNFSSQRHKKRGEVKYILNPKEGVHTGKIIDFIHEGGRGVPLALIDYGKAGKRLWLPPEGIFTGDTFDIGEKTEIAVGNTMCIKNIPEGTIVYNIEISPNDGGRFVRASGTGGTVLTRGEKTVVVLLPSGQRKTLLQDCRATIGIVAGGGKITKPWMKAGAKWHDTRTHAKNWPVVRGSVMNAASHPFGGGSKHRPGMSSSTSRNAPPGRKVGLIASSRTGRKKK